MAINRVVFFKNRHRPNDNELSIYEKILQHNGIPFIVFDSASNSFWEQLSSTDLFVFKWGQDHHSTQMALSILPVVERFKQIKCFPDFNTGWHYDDKVKQYYMLKEAGFPAVDSFVFWDKEAAISWLDEYNNFPLVFKLRSGSGSFSVRIVRTRNEALRLVKRMFGAGKSQLTLSIPSLLQLYNGSVSKVLRYLLINARNYFFTPEKMQYWVKHKNYVYFQTFLAGNDWDTRVTTAGNKVHAFRRFNRSGDFRASGSNNWDIDPDKIDKRMLRIALDVSKKFGFQGMAYDFVYDQAGNPRIIEMSYLYGGAGYPDFMNGYWDSDLVWHEGRFWPQQFELEYILDIENLSVPDLDTNTSYKSARIQ